MFLVILLVVCVLILLGFYVCWVGCVDIWVGLLVCLFVLVALVFWVLLFYLVVYGVGLF